MPSDPLEVVNAASTVIVAVFAVVQVGLAWMDRRDAMRTAAHVVMTEWQRLYFFLVWLKDEDLITLARHDRLLSSRVLPSDSALLSTSLATIGGAAAVYGGSAIAYAHQTASDIELLTYLARLPAANDPVAQAALRDTEGKIKKSFAEVVQLLEDAKNSAPRWVTHAKLDLGSPQSETGKGLCLVAAQRRPPSYWGMYPVPRWRLPPWR